MALIQRLLTETRALRDQVEEILDPAPVPTTEEELVAHVRDSAQTLYHPVGTCRIGLDDQAVVDPSLRVHGIEGLRVADASVMPTTIRGHTQAAAVAIGVRAVDLIVGGDDSLVPSPTLSHRVAPRGGHRQRELLLHPRSPRRGSS
jgi:choline dehydrogenase